MLSLLFGLVLAAATLVSIALLKTYQHIPVKELKRLARSGDQVASLLYRPVAYGYSLNIVLWAITGLAFAASVVLFAQTLPAFWAIIVVALVVWVGFAWIPTARLTKPGIWFARQVAPSLAWLLERLHPLATRGAGFVRRHRPVTIHTGLYEKTDLVELLEQQKGQTDNRIAIGEIDLLQHALSFGDKLVSDVLIPKRVVRTVNIDDAIGPALMDELHKSGHSRFPVYEGEHDKIVGILYLRDLIHTKKTGKVRDIMKSHLTYVHEDFTLYRTLQAFIKTKHHLFLVVNSFEELVGVITIEDILEQIIGKLIVDEFDTYDDLRVVAAAEARHDHSTNHEVPPAETPVL